MLSQNITEEKILSYIRFIPILFTMILSLSITIFILYQNVSTLKEEISNEKNRYINQNKELIKSELEQMYNFVKRHRIASYKKLNKNLKEAVYNTYDIFISIDKANITNQNTIILKNTLANKTINKKDVEIFFGHKKVENDGFVNKNINSKEYKCFYNFFKKESLSIGICKNLKTFQQSIEKDAIEELSQLSFKNENYLFIFTNQNKFLLHKNIFLQNTLAANNETLNKIKEIATQSSNKGSYVTYKNIFINDKGEKTSYVIEFKEYDWIMGIGFQVDEINKNIEIIKKKVKDENDKRFVFIFAISFLMCVLFLLASSLLSEILKNRFMQFKRSINNQILLNKKKEKILIEQSKMSLMGEMIGYISHQWKQPLNRINGINFLIQEKISSDEKVKKELIKYFDEIEANTEYMSQTIDYFSNFFNEKSISTDFSLKHTIQKALILLDSKIKKHNIEINTQNIEELNPIGLEQEYIQVILIILNNAIENFLEKNIKSPTITFKAKQTKNKIKLLIEDNGGGIQKDNIDKIFNLWFTTKSNRNGTGLGLYMAKFIVENALHGKIRVYCKKEITTFSIITKGKIHE